MSSYGYLQALTGVRYDAVEQKPFINCKVGDFTSFLSTESGFGNVHFVNGKGTLKIAYGLMPVNCG